MTKISRPNLTRGTKLLVEHTHGALVSVAGDLNAATVGDENLLQDKGVFRINMHIPYLANDYAFSTYTSMTYGGVANVYGAEGEPFSIPFTIPPYQQQFSFDAATKEPVVDGNTPKITLTELSISFDQRAEPVSIVGPVAPQASPPATEPLGNNTTRYEMDHDEVSAYTMQLSVWEKSPTFFNGPLDIERVIFNAPVDADVLSGAFDRGLGNIGNPTVFSNINAPVDPFKTYGISIRLPALGTLTGAGNTRNHAMVSVQISLKFKTVLVPRDIQGSPYAISNKPTKDTGGVVRNAAVTGISTTILTPAPQTVITSDDATGVNTQMATIDEVFRNKLSGGYTENCEAAAMQQLADDSALEVIAVPMFNNRRYGGIYADHWDGVEPYTSGARNNLWDRKIVPLSYPFVVHHVVLAWNWQRFIPVDYAAPYTGLVPATFLCSTAMTADIGVGIGSGMRGDITAYQQVAELSISDPKTPATWETHLIDKIKTTRNFSAIRAGVDYDWELHQVPLVRAPGVAASGNGSSWFSTNTPMFVGKAWSPTAPRAVMDGGGAPVTLGQEQFLEVRMKLGTLPVAPADSGEIIVGYQGHWLYIIGKKSLT